MARYVAFFARSLAVVSIVLVACSSSSSNGGGGSSSGGLDGGGTEGGNGIDGGDGSTEPIDAGPKPYGQIPDEAAIVYTCTQEIHVATTGDDTTGDGTAAKPYKTIVKGVSLATTPGTCVQVHAGTYAETATIASAAAGGTTTPIVLRAADGKGTAIIDGASNTAGPAIEVKHNYFIIDGFEIKNTALTVGLHVVRFDGGNAGNCVGSALRNSKITGGFAQLKVYQKTQGVLVEHNEFYGKSGGTVISLSGASGLLFRANYLHDLDSGDNGTTQLAGGSTGAVFRDNVFQDITSLAAALALGDGCGATCDNDPEHYAAVNARAYNNVFIRTIRAFDVLGCKECSVLANTIIDAGLNAGVAIKIGSATTNGTSKPTTGLRILNNIVTSPGSLMGYVMALDPASGDGLQMDYNLFYNGPSGVAFGQSHPATADTHSVQGSPLFVGPTDLRPGQGSPAIGAGTNLFSDVPTDFKGVARPASGGFDIGALQH